MINSPPHVDQAADTLKWGAKCLKLSQETYKRPQDEVPDPHWRTLCADLFWDGRFHRSPIPPERQKNYIEWKIWLTSIANKAHKGPSPLKGVLEYQTEFQIRAPQNFYSTEGGRIGRGAVDTRPGDIVCIFYQGEPCYILRYEEGSPVARLMGDAYIHGWGMYLWNMPQEIRKDEDFIIA